MKKIEALFVTEGYNKVTMIDDYPEKASTLITMLSYGMEHIPDLDHVELRVTDDEEDEQ